MNKRQYRVFLADGKTVDIYADFFWTRDSDALCFGEEYPHLDGPKTKGFRCIRSYAAGRWVQVVDLHSSYNKIPDQP